MKIVLLFIFISITFSQIAKYDELNPRHYCERRVSLFTYNLAKQVTVDSRAICPFYYGPVNDLRRSYEVRRIYYQLTTGGKTRVTTLPYQQDTYVPTIGINYVKHPHPKPVDPNNEIIIFLGQVFTTRFVVFKDAPGGTPNEFDDTDTFIKNANLNDSSLATSWEQFTKESQDLGSGDAVNVMGVKLLKEFDLGSISNSFEITAREVAKNSNFTLHGIRPERLSPQVVRITSKIDQLTSVPADATGLAFEYYLISYGNASITTIADPTGAFDDYPLYTNENQTSLSLEEPPVDVEDPAPRRPQGGFFSVRNLVRAYDISSNPQLYRGVVRVHKVSSVGNPLGLTIPPGYNLTRIVVSFPFQYPTKPYRIEFESSFGVSEIYISASGKMTLTVLGIIFSVIAYLF